MSSILGVPVDAAYHLVSGFTGFLTPVLGGAAAVAVIVLFTVAVRLIVMPLSLRGLRGQATQARLAPQLQELRKRHAKQPERLQREMTALYKREGTSMFAGLTPLLLQWPLLSVVYLLFRSAQIGGKPNTLLTRDLFGVPLGGHWLAGAAGPNAPGALIRVLPYLTVVIAAFVPLAAGIYLITSTGWALAERTFFWRTGRISGAAPSPPKPVVAVRN
jgi:YidC/Oxa1 family membrane protein insertase